MDNSDMPNRLREWRKKRSLSQKELGSLVGCNSQQISKLETGALRLSLPWMLKLSKALGCRSKDLLPSEDLDNFAAANQYDQLELEVVKDAEKQSATGNNSSSITRAEVLEIKRQLEFMGASLDRSLAGVERVRASLDRMIAQLET